MTTLDEPKKVHIKGADASVVARSLVAVTSDARRRGRHRSTLVGRDWELATVTGMLDQSMKGKGRIVGLVGPPGIGKSRLVAEIGACADRRAVPVYSGYCESHTSDLPFHAMANLLKDIYEIDRLDGDAARVSVRERLPDARERLPDVARVGAAALLGVCAAVCGFGACGFSVRPCTDSQ